MVADDTTPHSSIANKASLSVLGTEKCKIEGIVKDLNDELEHPRRRESKLAGTNSSSECHPCHSYRFRWMTLYLGSLSASFSLRIIVFYLGYPMLFVPSFSVPYVPCLRSSRRTSFFATSCWTMNLGGVFLSACTSGVPVCDASCSSSSHFRLIRLPSHTACMSSLSSP